MSPITSFCMPFSTAKTPVRGCVHQKSRYKLLGVARASLKVVGKLIYSIKVSSRVREVECMTRTENEDPSAKRNSMPRYCGGPSTPCSSSVACPQEHMKMIHTRESTAARCRGLTSYDSQRYSGSWSKSYSVATITGPGSGSGVLRAMMRAQSCSGNSGSGGLG